MRLNAIAHVRAHTMAARISPNFRQPGQPRFSRAATAIAARANGSAKAVCEKRTKEAHRPANAHSADSGCWVEEGINGLPEGPQGADREPSPARSGRKCAMMIELIQRVP